MNHLKEEQIQEFRHSSIYIKLKKHVFTIYSVDFTFVFLSCHGNICVKKIIRMLSSKDVDECAYLPCQEGLCINTVGSFHCDCSDGYAGPNCSNGNRV